MVRKILAIILLISVSCQFATKMGIVVWYQANIDYVAQELCENKDAPEKQCNGKCYLKKQLNKVDNNTTDKQKAPEKKSENQIPEFVASEYFLVQKQVYTGIVQHKTIYINFYNYCHTNSLFHPPPFSC